MFLKLYTKFNIHIEKIGNNNNDEVNITATHKSILMMTIVNIALIENMSAKNYHVTFWSQNENYEYDKIGEYTSLKEFINFFKTFEN